MLYPLYDYYKKSSLTLDEIVDHYVTRFYARKHNGKDVVKVLSKVKESSKIINLCGESATRRIAPNYVDFASVINDFMFKSNMTQALAVLFAALYWDERINSVYHLKSAEDLKDDIVKIFKKYSICEEMTESEFFGNKNENLQESPSSFVSNIKGTQDAVKVKSDEKTSKEIPSNTNTNNSNNTSWGLRDYYDFNESFKKHIITFGILRRGVEFCYFSSKNDSSPLWTYVIKDKENLNKDCPIGAEPLAWILKYYDNQEDFCWLLEVLDEQIAHLWADALEEPKELIKDIQKYVPSFKLGNDPQRLKTNIGWSWIDIHAILNFIDYCKESQNQSASKSEDVKSLQECSTIEELARLYWSDYNKEQYSRNEKNMGEDSKAEDNLNDPKIVCSWSLLDFAKRHGKMQVGEFINKNTGEHFKSCLFTNPNDGTRTFVTFSTKLGELTPQEIVAQKHELIVVEYVSGIYALSRKDIEERVHDEEFSEVDDNLITEVTEEDLENSWTDEYGVEYSEDKKRMIHAPETLEEYSVREGTEVICDDAFSNIEFEEFDYYEITEKGQNPYDFIKEVSKLKIVSLPNTIVSVGKRVFDYCVKLETIYIPKGEKEKFQKLLPDYDDLFVETENCNIKEAINKNMTKRVWTDEYGVQYDREHQILLKAPKDIVKYAVVEGTKKIANAAFSDCKSLKQILLPESLIEIGHYVFANCGHIISFAIPAHVNKMGNGVFMNCSNLWAIQLPICITEYETDTFQGCDSLRLVLVPKGGEFKYSDMLYGHDVIIREYDPQDAEEERRNDILFHAFVDETGMVYDFEGKVLFNAPNTMEECTIKSGISFIGDKAFKVDENNGDRKKLKRLFLPDTIELIGNSAFLYNEGLEYINIPIKAAFLFGENPFAGCKSLHSIKWDTQNALKEGTLIYNKERTTLLACLPWHYVDGILRCWTLAEFESQYGKIQIGDFTNYETGVHFKNCIITKTDGTRILAEINFALDNFSSQKLANMNDLYVVQMANGNYSLYKGNIVVAPQKMVVLSEGLETISANAFLNNEILEEITLPQSLKNIGVDAFKDCKSLKSIRIPKGTKTRFEKLLPERKDLLVEIYKIKKDILTNFELPDGSIYNGECISNPFGSVVLSGQGEVAYPNGDKYKGEFKNGWPFGWGKYRFQNGHSYRGYFKRLPNGIGYLNENYNMAVGNFFDGKLNGWGIRFRNNIFKFGYWENGKLVKDFTSQTLWVRHEITCLRLEYKGNLIQVGKEHDFIRFGIPQKFLEEPTPEIPISEIPKIPAWGFEFFKDGTVKVGLIEDHSFGDYMLCLADGSFDTGKWNNNNKTRNTSSFDLSNSHNKYNEDGLDVYKVQ